MKKLYEVAVVSEGGRDGRVKSLDGLLDMKVAIPKEMGGPGGATNPEQLFAAGYAACFENAILFNARAKKIALSKSRVKGTVAIGLSTQGPGEQGAGGFQFAVHLLVSLPGIETSVAEDLIREAHQTCPFSNATRGNIDVNIDLK